MNNIPEALEIFRRGPAVMEEALRGVTEDEAGFVPSAGKWTIRQIVRHVADTEIVVGMRLRLILAEEKPTLTPFDQELWAKRLGYARADVFESLRVFRTLREDISAVLGDLPESDFERVGLHPERGAKSLLEWVVLFGNHVETHVKQIRGIREMLLKT